MHLASDIGGLRGLGSVTVEADEPVFHEDWERAAFGMTMATIGKGLYSVDEFRHACEAMHPVAYLGASYYARWIWTLERLLLAAGVLDEAEVEARTRALALGTGPPPARHDEPEFADMLVGVLASGASPVRDVDVPRRFALGDRVVAVGSDSEGHTRLPRYARGKVGVVVRCDPAFVYPDSNARRTGEDPRWCYCVRFEPDELWGDAAEGRAPVFVDVWEPYLAPAPESPA